jgi:pimeloyl-ACP methyl ester carboxylesterase
MGFRDVVILLPGITGSVLADERKKEVWSVSGGALWKAVATFGASVTGLELAPGGDPGGVKATRLMPDATLLPGLIKIDGYSTTEKIIVSRLGLEPGANYFPFPYDWRLDNRIHAKALAKFAWDKLAAWRASSGAADARLVLIGHSMGGLIAQYFLEALGGWQDTAQLITLGTPRAGSLSAVEFIVNGMRKGIGPVGLDLSPLLRSFPSVYQLLPTYPCIDDGAGKLKAVADAALANLDPRRAADALAFHAEIENARADNAKTEAYWRSGYADHPIVGIEQPTAQTARTTGKGVEMLRSWNGKDEGGDGTVPRRAAAPAALPAGAPAGALPPPQVYAAEMHGSLQNAAGSLANIHGILTPLEPEEKFRAAPTLGISLDIDDVVLPGEVLKVRASIGDDEGGIDLRLTRIGGTENHFQTLKRRGDDPWHTGSFKLDPGVWRARASSEGRDSVTDLIVVAGS